MGRMAAVMALCLGAGSLTAQVRPDWRRIGNASVDIGLAANATGAVDRVWYAADGSLTIRTRSGRTLATSDYENWLITNDLGPFPERGVVSDRLPEESAQVRRGRGTRQYAIGKSVWRSDDGGASWTNLSSWRGNSLIGNGLRDLAVSPSNDLEIAVAAETGVWRSVDGGASWSGINDNLPNLPVRRIMSVPAEGRGLRLALESAPGVAAPVLEWQPGEKSAWRVSDSSDAEQDAALRRDLSSRLGVMITSAAATGAYRYAGSTGGRIWVSADRGVTWTPFTARDGGTVERFWVDAVEPRIAVAALGARGVESPATRAPHVLRTFSAGALWDDVTSNLPDAAARGITADRKSGAVYVATDRGLFLSYSDLENGGPATTWIAVTGTESSAPVMDVKLDEGGNQLFAAVDGFGVFGTLAPHRVRDWRVVSAADYAARAAAPGSLFSVLGARVAAARAGNLPIPVLAANENESQIQIPLEAALTGLLSLQLDSAAGSRQVGMAIQAASPAIFVDRDGTPMLLDADTGVMLDAAKPARGGSRIQILATGLGRVRPDWPSGLPAPLEQPPSVIATVRASVDRQPAEVTRAVLAPGYVGFYLVEVEIPRIVNAGPVELFIEAGGQSSNRVRLYLEP